MVRTSQILTVLSRQPPAIRLPSGEKVKLPTLSDFKSLISSAGSAASRSQNRIGLSRLPLARNFPSAEKATDQTDPIRPSNPFSFLPDVATTQRSVGPS